MWLMIQCPIVLFIRGWMSKFYFTTSQVSDVYKRQGMACAMAWVMFIIIALLTVIAFGSQKHWVYYAD